MNWRGGAREADETGEANASQGCMISLQARSFFGRQP